MPYNWWFNIWYILHFVLSTSHLLLFVLCLLLGRLRGFSIQREFTRHTMNTDERKKDIRTFYLALYILLCTLLVSSRGFHKYCTKFIKSFNEWQWMMPELALALGTSFAPKWKRVHKPLIYVSGPVHVVMFFQTRESDEWVVGGCACAGRWKDSFTGILWFV